MEMMSGPLRPLHFKKWIDENRHLLKPPVGNRQIWEDREFMVTVVGGPNARTDYHYNEGEEFFYQLEGQIQLKIVNQEGLKETITLGEGDIFLLPPRVPHSPQRPAGTLGLVIERKRLPGEKDGVMWFCEACDHKLYEEYFHLKNIVTDLQPVFQRFYSNEELQRCKKCGLRAQKN